jgi:hypothetical protein
MPTASKMKRHIDNTSKEENDAWGTTIVNSDGNRDLNFHAVGSPKQRL